MLADAYSQPLVHNFCAGLPQCFIPRPKDIGPKLQILHQGKSSGDMEAAKIRFSCPGLRKGSSGDCHMLEKSKRQT